MQDDHFIDAGQGSIVTRNAIEFVHAGRGRASREIGMRSTDSRRTSFPRSQGSETVGLRRSFRGTWHPDDPHRIPEHPDRPGNPL